MAKKNNKDVLTAFESRAARYDKEATWITNAHFIQPLVPIPFGTKKLLDVCAGTGAISCYANSLGWNVTATDISNAMLKKIPSGICVRLADVEDLPFNDNEFDLVTCRQGLQYVNIENALKSIIRVTKEVAVLAHITIWDEIDYSFWSEYYQIAKSGRKTVFIPGTLYERINLNGVSSVDTEVLTCWESLLSPIDHLETSIKNMLINMLISSSSEFKNRNHIVVSENNIMSERRWEIIKVTKSI